MPFNVTPSASTRALTELTINAADIAHNASQNDMRAPAASPAYTAISPNLSSTLSRTPPNFETLSYFRAIAPSTASRNPATSKTTMVAPQSQPAKPHQDK